MASVVFLRGVNVGGRRPLRPAALARELSALGVVNVGAAGTFVVGKAVRQDALRAELLHRLPFETELMIVPARDLLRLTSGESFPEAGRGAGVRRFVSVLGKRPSRPPKLPIRRPPDGPWQVQVVALHGRFALSLWRRTGKAMLYPNEVVEKVLGVAATTRGWDTLLKIREALRGR